MKIYVILVFLLLSFSCIRENEWGCDESVPVVFEMLDVPYAFRNDSVIGQLPYCVFTEQLELLVFRNNHLDTSVLYDYTYCNSHQEIPLKVLPDKTIFLFVTNLFDHNAMTWSAEAGDLSVRFSILNHEEPPVFLVSTNRVDVDGSMTIPVNLIMLVSRLEIMILNPPSWVDEFDVSVRKVARTMTNQYRLDDTTSVYKHIDLNNTGPGVYWLGVNTFPTYRNKPAILDIRFTGAEKVRTFVVIDRRLNLTSGIITRLNIEFQDAESIIISVEVNGKWEIVDEGQIII